MSVLIRKPAGSALDRVSTPGPRTVFDVFRSLAESDWRLLSVAASQIAPIFSSLKPSLSQMFSLGQESANSFAGWF